jgi:hypothetical protein
MKIGKQLPIPNGLFINLVNLEIKPFNSEKLWIYQKSDEDKSTKN